MARLAPPYSFQHTCRHPGALRAVQLEVGVADGACRRIGRERRHFLHKQRCPSVLATGVGLIVACQSRIGLRTRHVQRKAGSSKALRNISKALAFDEEESDDAEPLQRSGSSQPGCGQWYACLPRTNPQNTTGANGIWEAFPNPHHYLRRKPSANVLGELPADVAAAVLDSLLEGCTGDISGSALKKEFSNREIFAALKADAKKLLRLVRRPEGASPETIDDQIRGFLQQAWMRIAPQATHSKAKFRMAHLFGKLLASVPEKQLRAGFQQSLATWAKRVLSAAAAPKQASLQIINSKPTNAELLSKLTAAVIARRQDPKEQYVCAERLLKFLSNLLCGDSQANKWQQDSEPPIGPPALAEALAAIVICDAGLLTDALLVFRAACKSLDAATIANAGLWQLVQHSSPSLRILLLEAVAVLQDSADSASADIECWSHISASTRDVLESCVDFAAQEFEYVDFRPWTEQQKPMTNKAYAKKLKKYKALGMTWGPRDVGRVSVKDLAAAPSAELLQLGVASADTTTYNKFVIINAQKKEQDQQRREQEDSLISSIAAQLLRQLASREPQVLLNLGRAEAASLVQCVGPNLGPAGELLLGQLLDDVMCSPLNYTQIELFTFARALGNDVLSRHSNSFADVIVSRWSSLDYNALVENVKELPGLLFDAPQSLCQSLGAAYQREALVLTQVSQKQLVSIVEVWARTQSQPFPTVLFPMLFVILEASLVRFNDRQLLLAYQLGANCAGSVDATVRNAKNLGTSAWRSNSSAASRRCFQTIVQGLALLGTAKPREMGTLVTAELGRRVRASLSGQITPLHLSVAIAIANGETPLPCQIGSLLWSGLVASIHAQLTSPEQIDVFCQSSPNEEVWGAVARLCDSRSLALELQIRRPLKEDNID